jgi:hypothetical protein
MLRRRSHLGWRSLASLVFCGAVAGFAIPTIASSLVQQVKHEPAVRLLPAPRLPASETQPVPPNSVPIPTPAPYPIQTVRAPKALTRRELERKNPPPRLPSLPAPTVSPRAEAAPPSHEKPATPTVTVPKNQPPVGPSGGNRAPSAPSKG